jgi:protoporphyrinogen oxidase
MDRRDFLAQGGVLGLDSPLGHRLREPVPPLPANTSPVRRCDVAIVGAGISGLSAARALKQQGFGDIQIFDLEATAGGNSRSHTMQGMACPLGAHYLPIPPKSATDIRALLQELRVLHIQQGRDVYDERHVCHSPQERLWIDGAWQQGLLPTADDAPTLDAYARFAKWIADFQASGAFTMPSSLGRKLAMQQSATVAMIRALDSITFAQWLNQKSLLAPKLRWYLDYCCRDDYGVDSQGVSALAGVHYFASRHGFHEPQSGGAAKDASPESVLTWPGGNGWLSQQLAKPFAAQIQTRSLVQKIDINPEGKAGQATYTLQVWHAPSQSWQQWQARALVLAVPHYVARKLISHPPAALTQLVRDPAHQFSAWWTANLLLHEPLAGHQDEPMAWDNVIYQAAGLGYVNAMHQSLRSHAGPTVLTYYQALGSGKNERQKLLQSSWQDLSQAALQDIAKAHPDIASKAKQIDIVRYGHAMAVPSVGAMLHPARAHLQSLGGTLQFAHSDVAGYSVFEEAFDGGTRAGRAIAKAFQ